MRLCVPLKWVEPVDRMGQTNGVFIHQPLDYQTHSSLGVSHSAEVCFRGELNGRLSMAVGGIHSFSGLPFPNTSQLCRRGEIFSSSLVLDITNAGILTFWPSTHVLAKTRDFLFRSRLIGFEVIHPSTELNFVCIQTIPDAVSFPNQTRSFYNYRIELNLIQFVSISASSSSVDLFEAAVRYPLHFCSTSSMTPLVSLLCFIWLNSPQNRVILLCVYHPMKPAKIKMASRTSSQA